MASDPGDKSLGRHVIAAGTAALPRGLLSNLLQWHGAQATEVPAEANLP